MHTLAMTIDEKVRKTLAELGVTDALLIPCRQAWRRVPATKKGFLR